jgi:MYXO-CTERM domain-containing protein
MNSHVSNADTQLADDITGAQNLYGPPGNPANDNFANAVAITMPTNLLTATVTGYNTNATRESGEPLNASNTGGRSVWWKWTAPYDGNLTVDTKGSYFDTTLGVYTGSGLNSLTQVATNDDITRGVVQASTVTFTVKANTVYYFSVDGFNNAPSDNYGADSGGITLNLNYTPTGGTAPAITTQPANVTVTAGGNASFSVVATGTDPLTYQWFLGGSALSNATGSTLNVSNAQSGNAGSYTVAITNIFGTVTSSAATLTVNPVIVTPPPSSGGGGGGGGAPSELFLGALGLLAFLRWKRRRQ